MSLALTYRPRRFEDLVGQRAAQVILHQMVAKQAVPAALLFEGTRGTGKTTTARILAAALNCPSDSKPCAVCVSCAATFTSSHLDVIEIDAASNGLVADIRALNERLRYRSSSAWRVVILDEAQSISDAGFNALLKTLEEPPPQTCFILCTTEPGKIPDTVASRCMSFSFRRLALADIVSRLTVIAAKEAITVETGLLVALAERADGSMRDAVMLLDQISRVDVHTAEQYHRLMGHTDHAPGLLGAIVSGDVAATYERLDTALAHTADPTRLIAGLINCLRDVLVLRAGGEITKTGTALAARQTLALALSAVTAVNALKILWELKTKTRLDDARASLEIAAAMLIEVCGKDRANNRLTLAQMGGTA